MEDSLASLKGVGEGDCGGGGEEIWVNFSLALDDADKLQEGRQVQVLGELRPPPPSSSSAQTKKAVLWAHIVRDFTGVDPERYHASIAALTPHCPINVFRNGGGQRGAKRAAKDNSSCSSEEYFDALSQVPKEPEPKDKDEDEVVVVEPTPTVRKAGGGRSKKKKPREDSHSTTASDAASEATSVSSFLRRAGDDESSRGGGSQKGRDESLDLFETTVGFVGQGLGT